MRQLIDKKRKRPFFNLIPQTLYLIPLFFCLFTACEEIPPSVTGSTGPVEPPAVSGQMRQVLIEEFSGVRCVNCPAGSAIIKDLLNVHGPQLVAVSIHAGEFTAPYAESKYDFRTPAGNQLLGFLGEPFGYPTGVVNRKAFDGAFGLQLGKGQWAGFIAQEKAIPPKVKIGIEAAFDNPSRNLAVKVELFPQETLPGPELRLNVVVTESDIQDLQLTPASSAPDPTYKHQHVLRGMLTNFDGDAIGENLVAGAVTTRFFNLVLPAGWKEQNCKVVAFVSQGGSSKDVLQAHEVKVVE